MGLVTQALALNRSAGGIGFRIEIEDNVLAFERGKVEVLAGVGIE